MFFFSAFMQLCISMNAKSLVLYSDRQQLYIIAMAAERLVPSTLQALANIKLIIINNYYILYYIIYYYYILYIYNYILLGESPDSTTKASEMEDRMYNNKDFKVVTVITTLSLYVISLGETPS